jgi:cytoskeletal protein CcmA (bactofilin family)
MSSMFTRNDKGPEPQPAPAARTGEQPRTEPAPTPQAVAEPVKRPMASAQPMAATGQRGVSVISRALKITGQLESSEDIQIEGEVNGDVRAAVVRVGAGAKVNGTVSGEEVELSGTIEGKIEARKVVLTSSAHMEGDIMHQDIAIQSGAYIAGRLQPEYGKTNVQPLKAKAE